MSADCSVRVICRFRPVNSREKKEAQKFKDQGFSMDFIDGVRVDIKKQGSRDEKFTLDQIFDPNTNQESVYDVVARNTINDVLRGYNGTIFAFGQTGSGKTFTMFGPDDCEVPELLGIIPRCAAQIFETISQDTNNTEFTIKCSFLEIYMENVQDLLNPAKKALRIRESKEKGIYVDGLTEEFVTGPQDIADLIQLGNRSRAVSATAMNEGSSRSHSAFLVTIEQRSEDGSIKRGRMNLIDLAGSEKIGKTGATGQTLEEAKKINQSLSALGNCIHALTEGKGHIPYRDSKLTRLLQESLGGNTKTTLVITASPHIFNYEETVSTLKFGSRAKTIKNHVVCNQQKSAAELQRLVSMLEQQLQSLQAYVTLLEKQVEWFKSDEYQPGMELPEHLRAAAPQPAPAPTANGEASLSSTSTASLPSSNGVAKAAPVGGAQNAVLMAEHAIELDNVRDQMNGVREDLAEATSQLDESKARTSTFEAQIEGLEKKRQEAESQLESERKRNTEEREKAKHDHHDRLVQVQTLSARAAELEAQNEQLKSTSVEGSEGADKARKQNEILKKRARELERELETMRRKGRDRSSSLRQHEHVEFNAVKGRVGELEEENGFLVDTVARLEADLHKLQLEHNLSGNSNDLRERNIKIDDMQVALDRAREMLELKRDEVKKEREASKAEVEEIRQKLAQARGEATAAEEQSTMFATKLQRMRADYDKLLKLLKEKVPDTDIPDDLANPDRDDSAERAALEGMHNKLRRLETESAEAEKKARAANALVEEQEKELKNATEQSEREKLQFERDLAYARDEIKEKQDALKDLCVQAEKSAVIVNTRNKNIVSEVEELRVRHEILESQLEEAREEAYKTEENFDSKISALEAEAAYSRSQLEEKVQEIEKIKADLSSARITAASGKGKGEAQAQLVKEMEGRLQDALAELSDARNECSELKRQGAMVGGDAEIWEEKYHMEKKKREAMEEQMKAEIDFLRESLTKKRKIFVPLKKGSVLTAFTSKVSYTEAKVSLRKTGRASSLWSEQQKQEQEEKDRKAGTSPQSARRSSASVSSRSSNSPRISRSATSPSSSRSSSSNPRSSRKVTEKKRSTGSSALDRLVGPK
eukprot:TRINITY_DN5999_c0_g1_i1.p1 TRINITY_DN5999_c0_g1~~TRINITY_DN5999_c0_g1_i1.p1  ORF type:complete len:1108 (-),score=331.87 TRINITY_DN5999_c0_g1_i1:74-3397(-)